MFTTLGWRTLMIGMFDKKSTNPKIIRELKIEIKKKFKLPETTSLSIAELRCHEPGCPPIETVITARSSDGVSRDWRISKSAIEINNIDIEKLV